MCFLVVNEIKKLNGNNIAILNLFNSQDIPVYTEVEPSRIMINKYKCKPRQCFNCYEFGNVRSVCCNNPKYLSCSGAHTVSETCGPVTF